MVKSNDIVVLTNKSSHHLQKISASILLRGTGETLSGD